MTGIFRGIINTIQEGFIKIFSSFGRIDEPFDDGEYFQHYGFTSRPLPGGELIFISSGNNYFGIASDDRRYRLQVENGEVALYTDEGDKVHFKRNKTIEIVCGNKLTATVENEVDVTTKVAKVTASTSCEIDSPQVTINASASCGVTSPAVTINASGSCIINSPSVLLGAGATRSVVDERMLAAYNNHTHPPGGVPSPQLSMASHCTSITKAM